MPSPQLAQALDFLRQNAVPIDASVAWRRAILDDRVRALPMLPGIQSETLSAGGVPAEWVSAEGVTGDRVMLFLHGGGYVAAYRWLLNQGTPAACCAIIRPSADGGLVVATLLALRDAGDPLPACAVSMVVMPISPEQPGNSKSMPLTISWTRPCSAPLPTCTCGAPTPGCRWPHRSSPT